MNLHPTHYCVVVSIHAGTRPLGLLHDGALCPLDALAKLESVDWTESAKRFNTLTAAHQWMRDTSGPIDGYYLLPAAPDGPWEPALALVEAGKAHKYQLGQHEPGVQ
ncbi:MAG: hypothetical protein NXI11_00865 [Proteobacteria bacterium]|nr:hypothetical protein [Pseudomonadota bacterium]